MNSKQRKTAAMALENGTMKRCALLTLATIPLLAGCATTIDYSPNSGVPIDQAKQTILRALEEGASPKHVEVTNEKVRIEFDRIVRTDNFIFPDAVSTVSQTQTIYFKTLEHLRLIESGAYVVRALDAREIVRLTFVSASEEFAKELMDSLATMMQFAKKKSPTH